MYCHGLSLLDVQVITLHTPVSGKLEAFFKRPIIRKQSITVNRSYFKNNRNIILVNIAANYKTGATEATQIVLSFGQQTTKDEKRSVLI